MTGLWIKLLYIVEVRSSRLYTLRINFRALRWFDLVLLLINYDTTRGQKTMSIRPTFIQFNSICNDQRKIRKIEKNFFSCQLKNINDKANQ